MTDPQTSRQPAVPAQPGPGPGSGPTGTGGSRGEPAMATAATPAARMSAAIAGMAWPAALVAAIGMIAVGILLLVWPKATLTVVAILIGAALIVTGLLRLVDGITARSDVKGAGEVGGGMRAADIVIGLLAIVVGLYALKHHSLTVVVLALVVGVIWIIHGIGELIVAAGSGNVPGRGLRAVTGLVSLAAGLVILFWPGITLILLVTILGAWLLFYGLMLAVLALRLRREARTVGRAARPAAA
jgi:uncharacterized membrane protein HdeD (DUF308 family)